jgi:hypothetical protein
MCEVILILRLKSYCLSGRKLSVLLVVTSGFYSTKSVPSPTLKEVIDFTGN